MLCGCGRKKKKKKDSDSDPPYAPVDRSTSSVRSSVAESAQPVNIGLSTFLRNQEKRLYGLFTLHGNDAGTGTWNRTRRNGSQYIVQKCSHWSETGKGTRSIVFNCAGPVPSTCHGPISVQCEQAIRGKLFSKQILDSCPFVGPLISPLVSPVHWLWPNSIMHFSYFSLFYDRKIWRYVPLVSIVALQKNFCWKG